MENKIYNTRKYINEIDNFLIYLFFKRIELVKKIGLLKNKNNISLYVPFREKYIINKCISFSKKYNLSQTFIKLIFQIILNESKIIEKKYIIF